MKKSRYEKRQELRAKLGFVLPIELDTDFTLDRWLNSYKDDVIVFFNFY